MNNLSKLIILEDLQLKHRITCYKKAKDEQVLDNLDKYKLGELYQSGAEFTAPVLCTCCNNLIPFKDLKHDYRATGIDEEDVEPVSLCNKCLTDVYLVVGYEEIYKELIK